jgi:hypothetical protein
VYPRCEATSRAAKTPDAESPFSAADALMNPDTG